MYDGMLLTYVLYCYSAVTPWLPVNHVVMAIRQLGQARHQTYTLVHAYTLINHFNYTGHRWRKYHSPPP